MLGATIVVAVGVGTTFQGERSECKDPDSWSYYQYCNLSATDHFAKVSGGFGGFNRSLTAAALPPDKLENEMISFCM